MVVDPPPPPPSGVERREIFHFAFRLYLDSDTTRSLPPNSPQSRTYVARDSAPGWLAFASPALRPLVSPSTSMDLVKRHRKALWNRLGENASSHHGEYPLIVAQCLYPHIASVPCRNQKNGTVYVNIATHETTKNGTTSNKGPTLGSYLKAPLLDQSS